MVAISAILTAAGQSTRMGHPKPLLSWHGVTLVEYQIASLLDAGVSEIVVVLGHEHDSIVPYVNAPSVRSVVNHDYRQGKTTSIKSGLRSIAPRSTDILLLAVDQPRPAKIIRAIIEAHRSNGALITSPRYQGHGGHPMLFSARLKAELEAVSEERQGIREVFQSHRDEVNEVAIDDPIVRLDLNTPEAYEEAKVRFGVG